MCELERQRVEVARAGVVAYVVAVSAARRSEGGEIEVDLREAATRGVQEMVDEKLFANMRYRADGDAESEDEDDMIEGEGAKAAKSAYLNKILLETVEEWAGLGLAENKAAGTGPLLRLWRLETGRSLEVKPSIC